jgi:hypothetical protein
VLPYLIEETDSTRKLLVRGELKRKCQPFGKINLINESLDAQKETDVPKYYLEWIEATNPHAISLQDTFPNVICKKDYHSIKDISSYLLFAFPYYYKGIGFTNYWMDPLLENQLEFSGYFPFVKEKPFLFFNYTNNMFKPSITLHYSDYDWVGGIKKDKVFWQNRKQLGLNISFPFDFSDNPFLNSSYGFGVSYQEMKKKNDSTSRSSIFQDGESITAHLNFKLKYNLPYKNSPYHPIRKYYFEYNGEGASKELNMKQNFTSHSFDFQLGFAPLYDVSGMRKDFLSFVNSSSFEFINGKYLPQVNPGIDMNDNIPVAGGLITKRRYIRGIEKTVIGDKLLISKNDLLMKISDDLNFSIGFSSPILDVKYTALGLWSDYAKIWQNENIFEYKTLGYELRCVIKLFGISTVHRFGTAYDTELGKLGNYYQVEVPILESLSQ